MASGYKGDTNTKDGVDPDSVNASTPLLNPQPSYGANNLDGPSDVVCTSQPPASSSSITTPKPIHTISVCDAYILALCLGFFGAHHFYLRRPGFGVLYMFTGGLFGFGYLVDLFRIPCLVNDANRRIADPTKEDVKALDDAYLLWFVGGLFGFHHFYLERFVWGFLYLFTGGLFGIGWIVDGIRMKSLVDSTNLEILARPKYTKNKHIGVAYLLTIFPATGLLGFQHYYLGRWGKGIWYTLTLGSCGIGWLVDLIRMPVVVERQNKIRNNLLDPRIAHVDDAYIYCIPLGFLGSHHFYLKRYGWGMLYYCTCGLFGIGWIVDWFRLPWLVADYNRRLLAHSVTGSITVTVERNVGAPSSPPPPPPDPAPINAPMYPGYPGQQESYNAIYPQLVTDQTQSGTNIPSDQLSEQPPPYSESDQGEASYASKKE